ncbi:hypothetical protein ABIF68_010305 [Bradyrhizobium japonicum]
MSITWKLAKSGGKNYTIKKFTSGKMTVRRNDAFTWDGGTKLGEVRNLEEAIALIKVDSRSVRVDLRDY